MKLIQIGLGDFGFGWLKDTLLKREDLEVIGIVDKNSELLSKAMELPRMEKAMAFTDIKEALTKLKPDFILNVTPPGIHKIIDFIAFEHSIPILSEKPIAESFEEAWQILEKSIEMKVPIMIAENYRYNDIVRKARKLILEGVIGKIDSINIDFNRNHYMTNYHKDLEHPLLLDVTIHHMDMLRYLTSVEGKTMYARSWTPKWSWYKGYSSIDLLIDMEEEIKVSYRGSLSSFKNESDWLGDWRIEGEKGILKLSNGKINIIKNESETEIKVSNLDDSRSLLLDEFISSLKEDRISESDIKDNIKTFSIINAAIISLKSSKIVKI